jgi:gluconolactonase
MRITRLTPIALALGLAPLAHGAAAELAVPEGAPAAVIDLATSNGVSRVGGAWRHAETRVVEVRHRGPDANGDPLGPEVRTWDIEPRAGAADFDDSSWEVIPPESLAQRRGTGRLSFHWYRIRVRIPERVGGFDASGSTVVFDTALDDYAEIWVDGELPRAPGQRGGSVIAGWNAPNRVVIARGARPGQEIQLAVFGANGPLSNAPPNFIWVRHARLEFHAAQGDPGPWAVEPQEVNLEVIRRDPRLDELVPANPKAFKLAEGFLFTEGPVWVRDGYLLFSDPNANRIYRYDPRDGGALAVFREKSGYDATDIAEYGQPGSNGLALDARGRLTIDEHGRHRVTRLEPDGSLTVLAERYQGKRLNSPNDLVYRSDGTLFFTDPPFGLPRFHSDPRRELDYSGVFALDGSGLRLLARDLEGPNGIALSPDERFLYVSNWDPVRKVVMRYAVAKNGSLSQGRVLFDMGGAPGEEALDGLKVDERGNLYVSGPGGVWILSPEGTHLGTLRLPRLPANFAWGDDDGRTLYLTARSALYRVRLKVAGAGRPRLAATAR